MQLSFELAAQGGKFPITSGPNAQMHLQWRAKGNHLNRHTELHTPTS